MNRLASLLALAVFLTVSAKTARSADSPELGRVTKSFDDDWRFFQGDAPGADKPDYADAYWRALYLPHDWSIAGPYDKTNSTRGSGGFLPAGVGWYRKHFTLPDTAAGRRVFIDFDGVMANSDVWINGVLLGHRPYGYVSFRYELTGHLNFGKEPNILSVRADNSPQPASRWYSGAGIYRHVRLVVTDPVHLDHWGTFITTPKITPELATVHVSATVTNQSDVSRNVFVTITLAGPDGRNIPHGSTFEKPILAVQSVPAGQAVDFQQDIPVANPKLWDLEHPNLYRTIVEVWIRMPELAGVVDSETQSFGIRDAHFEPDTGFWLNGRNFKLKGACLHCDGGAFGAAVPLGVWERRLGLLRELGVNAIRTAHNPPAPEFLDLCDRMGFLVMDEMFDCWEVAKNPYDYHLYFDDWSLIDTRDTVRRDRNHPSIIFYSAGNEIHDTPKAEIAKKILTGLVRVFHENDPSRPVTQALFRPNVSHDYEDGLADILDVVGQNYRENEILAAHRQNPARKIVGTENTHDRPVWLALRDNPPYAGQFLWTGIDYLGEAFAWPVVASASGLLDRTGAAHPRGLERQSWWSSKPMVRIARRVAPQRATPADPGFQPLNRRQLQFTDWTPTNSQPHEEIVEVYSNCRDVELFLNGKSLGSKPLPADASPRTWRVDYAPGTLKAVAKNNRWPVATDVLRTAGAPAQILLSTDHKQLTSDPDDVAFVTAVVADKNGVPVPSADDLVTFALSGPGAIAAVDNGDNAAHEPFQASQRHAFHGRCVAILRATGASDRLVLNASAPGLKPASISIKTTVSNGAR